MSAGATGTTGRVHPVRPRATVRDDGAPAAGAHTPGRPNRVRAHPHWPTTDLTPVPHPHHCTLMKSISNRNG